MESVYIERECKESVEICVGDVIVNGSSSVYVVEYGDKYGNVALRKIGENYPSRTFSSVIALNKEYKARVEDGTLKHYPADKYRLEIKIVPK